MKLTNANFAGSQPLATPPDIDPSKLKGGIPPQAWSTPAPSPVESTPVPQDKLDALDALLDARRGELVNLPVFGAVYMAIVPHDRLNEIESAVLQEMARLKIPALPPFTDTTYELERKARILAAAVRRADDATHTTPLLSQEKWLKKVDDDLIAACFERYRDVRNRLDPIGIGTLSDEDMALISDAFKKKDGTTLLSYGAIKLVLWLLTMDAQQPSSPTPASSAST